MKVSELIAKLSEYDAENEVAMYVRDIDGSGCMCGNCICSEFDRPGYSTDVDVYVGNAVPTQRWTDKIQGKPKEPSRNFVVLHSSSFGDYEVQ